MQSNTECQPEHRLRPQTADERDRTTAPGDTVNILLVDDQPAKLLSYETILGELGETLLKADSAQEALRQLLKHEIAVLLIDVCMPDLDGFQLAAMIRGHPRYKDTAIIFVSAIHLADDDRLRAYEMGAVDYVPVPVVPEVLRAKVRVFAELYRKTRQLEQLNRDLERRVADRTAELESSAARLVRSEERRSLALAAGQMGSWEYDPVGGSFVWDDGQYRIFGVDPASFQPNLDSIRPLIHPDDWRRLQSAIHLPIQNSPSFNTQFRVCRPNGELRWCIGTAVASMDPTDNIVRTSGVTLDITARKEAEERQALLAREVDHRARNALALVQSIVRLTRSDSVKSYVAAVDGRIGALSRAHTLLAQSRWHGADLNRLVEEELAPYCIAEAGKISVSGPYISLDPPIAQTLALVLHELSTNAAKYGALSVAPGSVTVTWERRPDVLTLKWCERGGPAVKTPAKSGFGIRMITASVERQLQGQAVFDWGQDGLACALTVPWREQRDSQTGPAGEKRVAIEDKPAAPMHVKIGGRVLVIEDEALVAMFMQEVLTELDLAVVGPFSNVSEAMVAAVHEKIDAAIVDVNLDGQLVYPIADVLVARKIPFIFVTGYGAESIDRRFRTVPIVKKPVQRQVLQKLLVAPAKKKSAPVS